MTLLKLVTNGIRYHWRLYQGLAIGTIIASAVLTGALVVGDSVKETLRNIADARLGKITHALDWGNRYFSVKFERDMSNALVNSDTIKNAPYFAAVLSLQGVAEPPPDRAAQGNRLNRARVYGVDGGFWHFAPEEESIAAPGPQEALINEETARILGLQVGDDMVLRIPRPSLIPLEAPLSREDDSDTAVARVRVKAILLDAQLGRFSLNTDQTVPANIFINREWLSELIGLQEKANLLLAIPGVYGDSLQECMDIALAPEYAGYYCRTHPSGIVQLESERLFIEDAVVKAAQKIGNAHPTLTYLVNSIAKGDRETPYSFVVAGAAPDDTPEGSVCINQWLADMLQAKEGDAVKIAWYEPLPSGEFAERSAEAPIHKIIPMEALQTERELALQFPGLSDVNSCRDWDIGMPLEEKKLEDKDNEAYWNAYGQTPKLLTTFATGSNWWGNRFGTVMAIRFNGVQEKEIMKGLYDTLDTSSIGMTFRPVRKEAQNAVDSAMDFGGLFLGLSMFLIAAALVLLALLYAHGLQMRAGEMGTLLALGWTPRRVRVWLLLESLYTIVIGIVLGAWGGEGYARLLLYGLARFWPDAVAGTQIRFHTSIAAIMQGAAISAVCVLAVIFIAVVRACRRPARELLQRDFAGAIPGQKKHTFLAAGTILVLFLLTLLALFQGFHGSSDNQTIWFFVSGTTILATLFSSYGLLLGRFTRHSPSTQFRLGRLLLMQSARRRSRSVGIAIITGCGVFMVVSVASMHLAMTIDPTRPDSGTGGFSVFAGTTAPSKVEDGKVLGVERNALVPLRVWDGDDAGCLNLNRALRPKLFGVNPQELITRAVFAAPEEVEALWSLLEMPLEPGVIPALVGDSDTAMWGLQAKTDPETGAEYEYQNDAGASFKIRTVGKLPMRLSLFQGSLLISEANFTHMFPHEGGYRAFLFNAEDPEKTAAQLNRDYGKLGMEAVPAAERLRAFYAVERTYLAMFLVLGGLGLLLGAGGASIVVLRNLAERRAEFALFLAVGYEPRQVRRMALLENCFLVLAGILFGSIAAAIAIGPIMLRSQDTADLPTLIILLVSLAVTYLIAALTVTYAVLSRIPLDALRTE